MFMKKSFMIFVCFVLVFSMTLVSAHHNLDNTFEISQETIQTGEQVTNLNSNLFSLNEEHGETFPLNFFKRGELSREMTQIAEDRKEKMILLAQENPVLFFSNTFDYEERKKFPPRVQILIEDEVEVEGELSTWHFDDFTDPKNPTATFYHSIIVDDEELDFYPVFPIDYFDPVNVKVSGFQIDDSIVGFIVGFMEESEENQNFGSSITGNAISPSEDSTLQPGDETIGPVSESNSTNETTSEPEDQALMPDSSVPITNKTNETQVPRPLPISVLPEEEPEIAPPVVGIEEFPEAENRPILDFPIKDYKTAVILVKFLDTESEPFTKKEAHDLIFNGQFQKFFNEQSYGRVKFSGDVFGWYTLQKESSYTLGCGIDVRSPAAKDKALELVEISSKDYDKIIFIGIGPDCPTGGYAHGPKFAVVNGRQNILGQAYYDIPFSWTNLDNVLSHEMGHTLGAVHSNGLDCGDNQFRFEEECTGIEYGGYFDVMGAWDPYSLHFSALNKAWTGFLHPSEILEISESGIYTLNAIEDKKGSKKIAVIPSEKLYLEYRKGKGFDSMLNHPEYSKNQEGLLIYNSGRFLLDMNPTDLDWKEDMESAVLSTSFIKGTYFHGFFHRGTNISIINLTSNEITFEVKPDNPLCVRNPPFFVVSPPLGYPPSSYNYVPSTLSNTDTFACGNSGFKAYIDNSYSSDFFSIHNPDYFAFPGLDNSINLEISISENISSGQYYTIPIVIENLNSGLKSTSLMRILVK